MFSCFHVFIFFENLLENRGREEGTHTKIVTGIGVCRAVEAKVLKVSDHFLCTTKVNGIPLRKKKDLIKKLENVSPW